MTSNPTATPTVIPVTAFSNQAGVQGWPALAIGSEKPLFTNINQSHFWWVVVDLEASANLNVVVNTTSTDTTTVPSDVQQYVGNPQYFLFFICSNQATYNLPTGSLAETLKDIGANTELTRLEQIIEQIGTGSVSFWAYILGATMDTKDAAGFEASSNFTPVVMTMQFMDIDGVYTPLVWTPS